MTPEERVAVEICLGTPYCKPESRDPKDHDNECALRDPELLPKILEQMMCARGEERRAALAAAKKEGP